MYVNENSYNFYWSHSNTYLFYRSCWKDFQIINLRKKKVKFESRNKTITTFLPQIWADSKSDIHNRFIFVKTRDSQNPEIDRISKVFPHYILHKFWMQVLKINKTALEFFIFYIWMTTYWVTGIFLNIISSLKPYTNIIWEIINSSSVYAQYWCLTFSLLI